MSDANLQKRLITALLDPRCYPHAVKSVRVIETHISWILLAGEYAYKIKKAVDLGFLNYADLASRRFCCEEEIRLNLRTSPNIYLDVVGIGGSVEQPVFGALPSIEYAVKMHRFDADSLLDKLLMRDKLTARHIDALASTISRFHAASPCATPDSTFGTPATIHAEVLQNFEQMFGLLHDCADLQDLATLQRATDAVFDRLRTTFAIRREQGFVRECHGDLHLGNIALIDDEPVLFDCIEFSPALRWIDVMDEIAFTMMDLLHRDQPQFAWRLLNAILEASGDYAGVVVLRFYLAYRAAVRAKVCAIRHSQSGITASAKAEELQACRSYLDLARQCLAPQQAALIITHGLPGSGKTTFSQYVIETMGAIRIRSDVERKRLFGVGVTQSSREQGGDIYSNDATQRTYSRLLEQAQQILQAGHIVIVDAAFLRHQERERFRELAHKLSVPFAIASLYASDALLRQRLQQRRNDASEADVAVLEKLQQVQQPLSSAENAWSARFTTEQAPDSKANAQNWNRLRRKLARP